MTYTAFVILVLSFFIALVSFSKVQKQQQDVKRYEETAKGFREAIRTGGLNSLMNKSQTPDRGATAPTYPIEQGAEEPGQEMPRDIDWYNAIKAWLKAQKEAPTEKPSDTSRDLTTISRLEFEAGQTTLTPQGEEALNDLGDVSWSILKRGRLIGIGALYPASNEPEERRALAALKVAEHVKARMLKGVPSAYRAQAESRLYCYCAPRPEAAGASLGVVRFDVAVPTNQLDTSGSQR